MANLPNYRLIVKVNTKGVPLLIKLLFIPLHVLRLWLWLKCKITKEKPLKIIVNIGTDQGGPAGRI